MNRYQTATPRAAMMIAAVAMSALTLGLSVMPATHGSDDPAARVGAVSGADAPMAAGIAANGTPIIVYGVREQRTAFEPVRHDLPTRKEAG
jgi:hypothetical protein